jgi:hypothetical protein
MSAQVWAAMWESTSGPPSVRSLGQASEPVSIGTAADVAEQSSPRLHHLRQRWNRSRRILPRSRPRRRGPPHRSSSVERRAASTFRSKFRGVMQCRRSWVQGVYAAVFN